MIALCREAGLPTLDFEQRGNQFALTIWRDWLTEKVLADLKLSERQLRVINHIKLHGQVTNNEYRTIFKISKATATRDLTELLLKGIFSKIGMTGRAPYTSSKERAHKG